MYKVGDKVFYQRNMYKIEHLFNNGECIIQRKYATVGIIVNVSELSPVNNAPKPRHTIRYTVFYNVSEKALETFSSEKEAIEKSETLNKLSINIGDIFKHSDGTAVEVVNSTLEETEVMLEIAGSVYYSKYNTQQFLKEFTK